MKRVIIFLAAVVLATVQAAVDFHGHRYDAMNIMPVHSGDIVFVGNSITNMHEWWEAFGCRNNILNRGVSGCVSKETLDNIDSVVAGHPAKVFLMVGTNDLARKLSPYSIAYNVGKIVGRFKTESPETEIYIQSILPVAEGNVRSAEDIIALNGLYRDICERENLTYIDLWSKFVEPGTTHINPAYTKDGLHPYPSGYKVWCDGISRYVGFECIYEDRAFNDCGIPGSLGMRAAAFDLLPICEDDIVMLGDELIHGGEWHELLGNPKVRNRGSGWAFGTPWIETIIEEIPAIFSSGKSPAQIYIHAGAGEVARNEPADTVVAKMHRLVDAVKAAAPESKLFLMAMQPVSPVCRPIAEQQEINARIGTMAAELGAEFVDIFTPLEEGREEGLVRGNFVFGKGYLKMARILSGKMGLKLTRTNAVGTK